MSRGDGLRVWDESISDLVLCRLNYFFIPQFRDHGIGERLVEGDLAAIDALHEREAGDEFCCAGDFQQSGGFQRRRVCGEGLVAGEFGVDGS